MMWRMNTSKLLRYGALAALGLTLMSCGQQAATPVTTVAPAAAPAADGPLTCPSAPEPITAPIALIHENRVIALTRSGGPPVALTPAPPDALTQEPTWSPDGQTLAFLWTRFGSDPAQPDKTLVLEQLLCGLDRATGAGRLLQRRERATSFWDELAWAADGKALLVTVVPLTDGLAVPDVLRFDLAAHTEQPLLRGARNASLRPDGQQLAFLQVVAQGEALSATLVLGDGKGGAAQPAARTTPPFGYMAAPRWSPDGQRLLFTANGGPQSAPSGQRPSWLEALLGIGVAEAHSVLADVWIMSANGQDPRRLTTGLDDPRAAWSPDGQQIVYTGTKGGGVYLLDLATGATKQLTDQGRASPISWAK